MPFRQDEYGQGKIEISRRERFCKVHAYLVRVNLLSTLEPFYVDTLCYFVYIAGQEVNR